MAYCIKCGVELASSEKECPLCHTAVIHPEIKSGDGETLYPRINQPKERVSNGGLLFIITVMYICPAIIVALCDLKINSVFTWSGFVISALMLVYIIVVLPIWFKKPNPVIFTPIDFSAIALFLFYINYHTNGNWFLSLALPITVASCLIVTAVVTLVKYLKKGYLYIFGGAIIAIGGLTMLIELMINVTFSLSEYYFWSLFSFIPCFLLGMALIVIAICKPLKESLKQKFFI